MLVSLNALHHIGQIERVHLGYYIQRQFFEILSDQTEIRLYTLFSDLFGTKWTSAWFQINRKLVNTICFWFDLIRFLCVLLQKIYRSHPFVYNSECKQRH